MLAYSMFQASKLIGSVCFHTGSQSGIITQIFTPVVYISWLVFIILIYETIVHIQLISIYGRHSNDSALIVSSIQIVLQAFWYTLFAQLWQYIWTLYPSHDLALKTTHVVHKFYWLTEGIKTCSLPRQYIFCIFALCSQLLSVYAFQIIASVYMLYSIFYTQLSDGYIDTYQYLSYFKRPDYQNIWNTLFSKTVSSYTKCNTCTVGSVFLVKYTYQQTHESRLILTDLDGSVETATYFEIRIVSDDQHNADWVALEDTLHQSGTFEMRVIDNKNANGLRHICYRTENNRFFIINVTSGCS